VGEVAFDRSDSHEEGLGDLAICQTFSGQFGDAALAGGQCFESGKEHSARLGPGSAQFGLGP
jgi:hypothetical protein